MLQPLTLVRLIPTPVTNDSKGFFGISDAGRTSGKDYFMTSLKSRREAGVDLLQLPV
jgi:hypothetical protein